ncbi:hypothetical protein [Nostoc sp. DedQUE09]|uniref:hypothetical protein n=1 Tax=Nostoc sp. DedQUE09 TaxID=3075394 RepID=UPI002AD3302C|nr:hypothetical protein [Nostoc sp. DedQUE09]MDZ7955654.1 hypothetical protein [Nostoc sp. DedQUE09]
MTISNTTLPMRYWCYLCQILLQHLQINVIYRLYAQQYCDIKGEPSSDRTSSTIAY